MNLSRILDDAEHLGKKQKHSEIFTKKQIILGQFIDNAGSDVESGIEIT